MITIRKVLVPIDFSENSRKAVDYGVEIARDRKSKLHYLHVINQRTLDTIGELSSKGYKGDILTAIRNLIRAREQELDSFIPQSAREGFDVLFVIRQGKPADEIIKFAREAQIDLIIAGTKGRSALEAAMIGSVTASLVNHAPCPVLVVRPVEHDFISS